MNTCVGSLSNTNILSIEPVITPQQLNEKHPLTTWVAQVVSSARADIVKILNGEDQKRIMVMAGPCSVHSPKETLAYADLLSRLARLTKDRLLILMRVYFEKPRTRLGWKGFINDPHLDDSGDFDHGVTEARKLLLEINSLGLPVVTEFLDPLVPQYFAELISTGTIGARTTESQNHREMASGLSMPIGFKNGTDGNIDAALNAIVASRGRHFFLGVNEFGVTMNIHTAGNPHGYLMLRGGRGITNFDAESIARVTSQIKAQKLDCKLVVDCSHDNSEKNHVNQAKAFRSVLEQVAQGNREIVGMMLESNHYAGKQDLVAGVVPAFGVSITDACIGWNETERLIVDAYCTLSNRK